MSLRRAVLACAAAIMAATAGCSSDPVSGPELELTEPRFDVSLPPGWREPGAGVQERAEEFSRQQVERVGEELGQELPPIGYEILGFTPGKPSESASAEVAFEPLAEGISLDDYAKATQSFTGVRGTGSMSGLEPADADELDGDETTAYTYVQEVGRVRSEWLTVQAIHDEATGVTLNLSAPPGELGRYRSDFDRIVSSWRWLD